MVSKLRWGVGFEAICVIALASTNSSHAHDFRYDGENNFPEELEIAIPTPAEGEAPPDVLYAVIDQYKLWEAGSTLGVCFFGGERAAREFFVQTAARWDNQASISFNFGSSPNYRDCDENNPSHIRVGFANSGNWSYVGTDSLRSGFSKPSLNIGIFAEQPFSLINQNRAKGTILHELGHALALQHEHQSPASNCENELKFDVIYADLARPPNKFDKVKVDHNMRRLVATPRLRVTEYDPKSIMHYTIPARWLKNGTSSSCWVERNDNLSETDVAAIRTAYPATLGEQAQYIAQLDTQTATAVGDLGLSNEMLQLIQQEINSALNGAVEDRGLESNFINSPIIQEQISQNSTGPGSSAIQGVGGDANVTTNVDQSQQDTSVSAGNIEQNTNERCSSTIAGATGPVSVTANCP